VAFKFTIPKIFKSTHLQIFKSIFPADFRRKKSVYPWQLNYRMQFHTKSTKVQISSQRDCVKNSNNRASVYLWLLNHDPKIFKSIFPADFTDSRRLNYRMQFHTKSTKVQISSQRDYVKNSNHRTSVYLWLLNSRSQKSSNSQINKFSNQFFPQISQIPAD